MYKIAIRKQKLNFSAAHFITYENDCEALHGHNYYTTVEMWGKLDENAYLMDFKLVKGELDKLCKALDHKVLMATQNPHLSFAEQDGSLEVLFLSKKYLFPLEDVVQLPIANTTVEKLAEHISGQLIKALREQGKLENISSLEVGVEETAGQMASFRVDFQQAG
jgi:6-pyruvoyltetrahydropterin/6-carboxytetrahydropterin synthase